MTDAVLVTPDGPVVVTEVEPSAAGAANLPVKAAGTWVNRSLWAGTGIYAITQVWAAAFDAAGFDGIVYPPRFALGAHARSLALFGEAGPAAPPRPVGAPVPFADVLDDIGIELVTPPTSVTTKLAAGDPPPDL